MLGKLYPAARTCNTLSSSRITDLFQTRLPCSHQASLCLSWKYPCQRDIRHRERSNVCISAYARWSPGSAPDLASKSLNGLLSGLLATALLLSSTTAVGAVTTSQDKDDSLTIKFKASKDPAIREAQEALVQTWGYASTQFLDPTFNGVNWPQQLQVQLQL